MFTDTTFSNPDVVVKNLSTGAFTLVGANAAGTQVGGNISGLSISDDGRYVAFDSDADGLVAGDANGKADVFVKDLVTGALTLVSKNALGTVGDDASSDPVLSGDGRYLAFSSDADNLVAGDTNNAADVFRSDWQAGAIVRVSTAANGDQAGDLSGTVSISQDGRYVAFASEASNLVAGDGNKLRRRVRQRYPNRAPSTLPVKARPGKLATTIPSRRQLSRDGRTVAYTSLASNLTADDVNKPSSMFLRDDASIKLPGRRLDGIDDDCRRRSAGTGRLGLDRRR